MGPGARNNHSHAASDYCHCLGDNACDKIYHAASSGEFLEGERLDWITTIVSSLITGGLGATISAIYSARKSAQVGMNGNEVEAVKATTADWTAFTSHTNEVVKRQDEKIEELSDKVDSLNLLRLEDLLWINVLTNHINQNLGPPAPQRPVPTNQNGS